jgi:hypothetical protein
MRDETAREGRSVPFGDDFLDGIRRIDMMDVVSHFLPTQIHAKMIRCPFHPDDNPSMRIYDDHAYCFGCHWHGDQVRFVMELEGLSFRAAVVRIAEVTGIPLEFASAEEREAAEQQQRRWERVRSFLSDQRETCLDDRRVLLLKTKELATQLHRMGFNDNGILVLKAGASMYASALDFHWFGQPGQYLRLLQNDEILDAEIWRAELILQHDGVFPDGTPMPRTRAVARTLTPEQLARLEVMFRPYPGLMGSLMKMKPQETPPTFTPEATSVPLAD